MLLKSILIASGLFLIPTAAQAGTWQLNISACPDLVEDRIDQRVTTSRKDLREDIRDQKVTYCPVSAWTYVPTRGEAKLKQRPVYTGVTQVIYQNGIYRPATYRNVTPKVQKKAPAQHRNDTDINIIIR